MTWPRSLLGSLVARIHRGSDTILLMSRLDGRRGKFDVEQFTRDRGHKTLGIFTTFPSRYVCEFYASKQSSTNYGGEIHRVKTCQQSTAADKA